jgi:TATA-binding protein-associated factor
MLPINETLATKLSTEELSKLFDTLWDCLAADTDELGSSTGSVMDLLGEPVNCLATQADLSRHINRS